MYHLMNIFAAAGRSTRQNVKWTLKWQLGSGVVTQTRKRSSVCVLYCVFPICLFPVSRTRHPSGLFAICPVLSCQIPSNHSVLSGFIFKLGNTFSIFTTHHCFFLLAKLSRWVPEKMDFSLIRWLNCQTELPNITRRKRAQMCVKLNKIQQKKIKFCSRTKVTSVLFHLNVSQKIYILLVATSYLDPEKLSCQQANNQLS